MKMDGFRVLDLSLFLPGPMLTQVLADHGAEVIKVEPPTGEPVRNVGYREGGVTTWFRNTHRSKRSIVLNLKDPDDHAVLVDLCRDADVVIEAFRPGVVDRLGIGPDVISALNPRVVYCSISAFGQTGPEVARPAHDLSIEAMSGVVSLNLAQDGHPVNPHMPVADMAGSFTALAAVLMALLRREKTGKGDVIDISMQDATMAWLPNVVGPVFAENRAPVPANERSFGGYAFFSIYPTSDHRHLTLGGVEHKFVQTLLNDLERPDLIEAAMGPPGIGQVSVKAFLTDTFARQPLSYWIDWFEGRNVCFAPVLNLHEAWHQPQVAAREMLIRDEGGNYFIGNPIKYKDEPGQLNLRLPELDGDGADIRDEMARKRSG
jgi:crotonobetainyl-CoA:carnitine CoA-transferase CaiB-like acyl-CoA transferase|tara:strand:- start:61 stop:1188 length:1128 start_codon:yes stop_codon:yes gene_type:complete